MVQNAVANVETFGRRVVMTVAAIPEGYYSLTPYLVCKGAAKAIDFYAKAFGAHETVRMPGPHGQVMHAEMKIGNSMLMLSDENPERGAVSPQSIGGTATSIMFYCDDVDAVFTRAVSLGATSEMAPADQFWGDRMGNLVDPFGHKWAIATHTEDVSPEEMRKRMLAIGMS
jgi:PhnB protein